MKNGEKPEILKDKINYEVMGANEWRSAPSLDKMANGFLKLYLSDSKRGKFYSLKDKKATQKKYLYQEVDFADRQVQNNEYYPDPIIRKEIDTANGFAFVSEPLKEPILINGSFLGEIKASINKKDMDVGVTLYEVMPNGNIFIFHTF